MGHFKNHLLRKLQRPEFADYIRCWFPEDDLRIKYSPAGDRNDWLPITQGSQGQCSAALLAFGDEPLILDQPEDDLDNHLIYELIVQQIRENKRCRQLIIVSHNPNVVINGNAEMIHILPLHRGQCKVLQRGALAGTGSKRGGMQNYGRWTRGILPPLVSPKQNNLICSLHVVSY